MGATGKSASSQGSGATIDTSGQTTTTNEPEYTDLNEMSHNDRRALIAQLQNEMGQTGYEAGDPNASPHNKVYVNSSRSYNINYYLNTDGQSIDSPNSDWQNLGYTIKDVEKAIKQIDKGMKPMSQNILSYRYVTAKTLGRMLGTNMTANKLNSLISQMQSDPTQLANFNTMLANADYTQKAYTSTSYRKGHSTFDKYPVILNVKLKEGTPAIVTNNHAEHEILAGRGLTYKFSNARVVSEFSKGYGTNKDYLVIDVDLS